jgi:hypothetical protein
MEKRLRAIEVVNCKVKYIRPTYNNLKEWMEDDDNVYIGRPNVVFIDGKRFPQKDIYNSVFANPYKVIKNKDGSTNIVEVLKLYVDHIKKCIDDGTITKNDLLALSKKKRFGCWCVTPDNRTCHGEVLKEILLRYFS